MDMNLLRSLLTAVMFAVFIGIVLWAWSARRRTDFEAAARLPLDDDQAAGEGRVR
jgi:cytochrome c oxidase cbb3-type subunit 4